MLWITAAQLEAATQQKRFNQNVFSIFISSYMSTLKQNVFNALI